MASCTRPRASLCIAPTWKTPLPTGCSLEPTSSVAPWKNALRVVQRRGQGWKRQAACPAFYCWRPTPASAFDVSLPSSVVSSPAAAVVSAPPCLAAARCSLFSASSSSSSVAASALSEGIRLAGCFAAGLCCFAQLHQGSSPTFPFVSEPHSPPLHTGSCFPGFPHSGTAACFFSACFCSVCLFYCGQCLACASSSLSCGPCCCSGICQLT